MTIHPEGFVYDAIFIAIFAFCVVFAARRGAFRAIAGIAGTGAGVVLGTMLQEELAPKIAVWLQPLALKLTSGDTLPKLTLRIENLGLPEELQPLLDAAKNAAAGAEEAARAALAEKVASFLCDKAAPVLAFILIFFLTKLAVYLLCAVFSMDIPVISGLNRGLGALLGAVSGLFILLALTWGIRRFAPDFGIPLLSREALESSLIGGFFFRLFN